jgi:3-oxoacyl-[acyl-carrier-protein] synthase-1/3-oxoacyl-[acyl-carrier-protein] synthase II
MEWKAIERLFGVHAPYVHPFKAQIGHTLGAAGVLETLALARAVELGCIPAAVIPATPDPETPARLAPVTCAAPLQAGLKLSAAFGGANAALIVERADVAPSRHVRPARRAFVRNFAQVDAVDLERLALVTGQAQDKLERLDALSLLAASAVAQLQDRGALAGDGAGVVVGHSLATLDINERFFSKVLGKGPRFAEPKLFPPTSPNLVAGQLAILFGLRGPSAALAGGPNTALDPMARTLVRCGDCERVVVVAIDYLGETSRFVQAEAFAAHEDVQHGATVALVDCVAEGSLFELRCEPPRVGFGRIALLDYLRGQGS